MATSTGVPVGVWVKTLDSRLVTTWVTLSSSAVTVTSGAAGPSSPVTATVRSPARTRKSMTAFMHSSVTQTSAKVRGRPSSRRASWRRSSTSPPIRCASDSILSIVWGTSPSLTPPIL